MRLYAWCCVLFAVSSLGCAAGRISSDRDSGGARNDAAMILDGGPGTGRDAGPSDARVSGGLDDGGPRDCTPQGAGGWRSLGSAFSTESVQLDVGVTPGGDPVVVYLEGSARRPQARVFDGAAWVDLGAPIATSTASFVRVATGNGLHALWGQEDADGQERPHVARWSGSEWEMLGTGFGAGVSHTPQGALAVHESGDVIVLWTEQPPGTSSARRSLQLYRWTQGQWATAGPAVESVTGAFTLTFDDLTPLAAWSQSNEIHVAHQAGSDWTELAASPFSDSILFNPQIASTGSALLLAYAGPGDESTSTYLRRFEDGSFQTVVEGLSEVPGQTPAVPTDLLVDDTGLGVMIVREVKEIGGPQVHRVYRERSDATDVVQLGEPVEHSSVGRLALDGCGWIVAAYIVGPTDAREVHVARWEE